MSYIHARHYYLKNKSGYKVFIYNSQSELLQSTNLLISNSEVEKNYSKIKKIIKNKIKNNQLMEDFWQHATEEMKKALCLSYNEHKIKKNKKVSNIQISGNWTVKGFFADEYKKLSSKNFLNQLLQFRIKGRHYRGIRFDHIHLVEDIAGSKHIFSIHWDNYSPKFFSFEAIYHFVMDDILS